MNDQLTFYENVPVAIYSCDALGYITSYNKAAAKLWGISPVIGQDKWCGSWKIFDLTGKEVSLDSCPMARAIKEGKTIEGEEIIVQRPDGNSFNIIPHPIPVFDSAGNVTGAINTLIDVTEQRKGEVKQRILASIVESTEDAIISKTLEGIITSWNKGAEKIFKYTEEEVLGKHITLLIPVDQLDEEKLIIGKIIRGEKLDHFETTRVTKDGRLIPISLTVSPIKNSDGTIIGASKIARDITLQKQAEQAIQQHSENLELLNAKKDEFISIASHELKTPLTSMKGFLELLNSNELEPQNKLYVQKALSNTNKLERLIYDLLDVSKIQAGQLQLTITEFDIDKLITECIHEAQAGTFAHNIINKGGMANPTIYADRNRIEQVIINLLSNAIKYSPKGGNIIVKTSGTDTTIIISIQDSGIGLAMVDQEKIFDRFYRSNQKEFTATGFGLGLYICSQIIKRHKGRIWVESEMGSGSTFYFELPIKAV
jgi:PAS domain S-box-containing protein